jgi:hypothetical protein
VQPRFPPLSLTATGVAFVPKGIDGGRLENCIIGAVVSSAYGRCGEHPFGPTWIWWVCRRRNRPFNLSDCLSLAPYCVDKRSEQIEPSTNKKRHRYHESWDFADTALRKLPPRSMNQEKRRWARLSSGDVKEGSRVYLHIQNPHKRQR